MCRIKFCIESYQNLPDSTYLLRDVEPFEVSKVHTLPHTVAVCYILYSPYNGVKHAMYKNVEQHVT